MYQFTLFKGRSGTVLISSSCVSFPVIRRPFWYPSRRVCAKSVKSAAFQFVLPICIVSSNGKHNKAQNPQFSQENNVQRMEELAKMCMSFDSYQTKPSPQSMDVGHCFEEMMKKSFEPTHIPWFEWPCKERVVDNRSMGPMQQRATIEDEQQLSCKETGLVLSKFDPSFDSRDPQEICRYCTKMAEKFGQSVACGLFSETAFPHKQFGEESVRESDPSEPFTVEGVEQSQVLHAETSELEREEREINELLSYLDVLDPQDGYSNDFQQSLMEETTPRKKHRICVPKEEIMVVSNATPEFLERISLPRVDMRNKESSYSLSKIYMNELASKNLLSEYEQIKTAKPVRYKFQLEDPKESTRLNRKSYNCYTRQILLWTDAENEKMRRLLERHGYTLPCINSVNHRS